MSDRTGIEWTDATWNPVTGCTEVSDGCTHCYAKTFAERWRGTAGHYFEHGFDVQLRPEKLDRPLRWKRPRRIFVNSMSDLFHDSVPDEYIARVWATMAVAEQHTFQLLTKRHARMRSLLSSEEFKSDVAGNVLALTVAEGDELPSQLADVIDWWPLRNVWLGVSAENQQWADIRIPALLDTPAAIRFVSAEPLLGPTMFRLSWLHRAGRDDRLEWVIVGGESGAAARPMHPEWARTLRDQCQFTGTPFLFKQWGEYRPGQPGVDTLDQLEVFPERIDIPMEPGVDLGPLAHMRRVGKKAAGRELDGRTWDEYPPVVL